MLDASLTVLQTGCALHHERNTFAVRMRAAAKNSTLTLRIEPALRAALKAAEAERRFIARKKGTRWTVELFWAPLLLRR